MNTLIFAIIAVTVILSIVLVIVGYQIIESLEYIKDVLICINNNLNIISTNINSLKK